MINTPVGTIVEEVKELRMSRGRGKKKWMEMLKRKL